MLDATVNVVGTINVLAGSSTGAFTVRSAISAGGGVNGLALGDLDKSGTLDLVTANDIGGNVSILLGAGGGAFAQPVSIPFLSGTLGVAVGRVNADTILDVLVTTNYSTSQMTSVLLGKGDGKFDNVGNAPAYSPIAITTGDFNGDTILDYATIGTSGLSVRLGVGDGTFLAPNNYSPSSPSAVAAGDLNRDGKLDLVVTQSSNIAITAYFGLGDGKFAPGFDYPAGVKPMGVALGDLNGDGWLDVITANADSNNFGILWNGGTVCASP